MIIGGWRGPRWRVIDAHPSHGSQIRRWITSAIAGHDCPVDVADAASAVAELFANAVMHGPAGGRVLVGYCLWRHGARIVVCDGGGPTTPQLRQAGTETEGGRGLRVVDSLSARWGTFRLPGAQVVWCDFGQQLRVPASDAWAWLRLILPSCALSAPASQRPGSGQLQSAGLAVSVKMHGLRGLGPVLMPVEVARPYLPGPPETVVGCGHDPAVGAATWAR